MKNYHKEIIEPIGHMALERNPKNSKGPRGASCLTSFRLEFAKDFCDSDGYIDWPKLVEFNSGNMQEINGDMMSTSPEEL